MSGSCKYSHYQRKLTAGLLRKREGVWLKARTAGGVESTEVHQEQRAGFGRVICCMLNSHTPVKAHGDREWQASFICLVNELQSFSGLPLLVMCSCGSRCASQIKPLDIQGALAQEGRVQAKQVFATKFVFDLHWAHLNNYTIWFHNGNSRFKQMPFSIWHRNKD